MPTRNLTPRPQRRHAPPALGRPDRHPLRPAWIGPSAKSSPSHTGLREEGLAENSSTTSMPHRLGYRRHSRRRNRSGRLRRNDAVRRRSESKLPHMSWFPAPDGNSDDSALAVLMRNSHDPAPSKLRSYFWSAGASTRWDETGTSSLLPMTQMGGNLSRRGSPANGTDRTRDCRRGGERFPA